MKVINDYMKRMNEVRKEIAKVEAQMSKVGTVTDYNDLQAKKYIAMTKLATEAEAFTKFLSGTLGDEMDIMNPGAQQIVALHFARL